MNYMPEVLKILGVEVGEKFNIKEFALNPYQFDEEYNLIDMEFYEKNRLVQKLLIGKIEIEKLPWKPKEGEYYYYVDVMGLNAETEIGRFTWVFDGYDYLNFNVGNCFRTEEEITPEIKERILREMKGKYEND
jgi:hypothetical protein